jgi:hypothetical protein
MSAGRPADLFVSNGFEDTIWEKYKNRHRLTDASAAEASVNPYLPGCWLSVLTTKLQFLLKLFFKLWMIEIESYSIV